MHNNFQTPVYYDGILYPSVTHAYHAARTCDEVTRRAILNAETFQILGNIAIRIEDPSGWQERKVKVMEQLLRDKFRRSKELQDISFLLLQCCRDYLCTVGKAPHLPKLAHLFF